MLELELYYQAQIIDAAIMLNKRIDENYQEDLEQLSQLLGIHSEAIVEINYKSKQVNNNKEKYLYFIKYMKGIK